MKPASSEPSKPNQEGKETRGRDAHSFRALLVIASVGLLMILMFSCRAGSFSTIFSVAIMVASASTLVGGLMGFLFGIPRTVQQQKESEDSSTERQQPESNRLTYAPNTNLEQISDWLTKILVGAGLIELSSLRQGLGTLSGNLAPAFGGGDLGRVFSLTVVLSYTLLGFLLGYLWTRLYFAGALRGADVASLFNAIQEIRQQSDIDAGALALVLNQLNPSGDTPPPTQEELDGAIRDASKSVKAQIFYLAANQRAENWREPRTKAKMERTIPIFEALTHCDPDDEYHQNYGQLGFALKDSRTPRWLDAENALTKAIEIRGPGSPRFLFYEFNRACCRIMLDDQFRMKAASSIDYRTKILEDLGPVFSDRQMRTIALRTDEVIEWQEINGVNEGKA
jgi:hypothetical protein